MPPTLLDFLERLLAFQSTDFRTCLAHACDLIAETFEADKVDGFIHDASRTSLVAIGASNQPLSSRQRALDLDVVQIANGGSAVAIFETGKPYLSGHLENDDQELRGIKEGLGIRSQIGVPFDIGGTRLGVLLANSTRPDFFEEKDLLLLGVAARWVGMVVHRSELAEAVATTAMQAGRRGMAEELITVLAHDLNNLLHPVLLRIEVLRHRAARDRRDDDIRDGEKARASIQRVAALANNLLDVTRIDKGLLAMDIGALELVPFLRDLAARCALANVAIEIRAATDMVVVADRERLGQVVENLLGNAVKHSPPGGTVVVEAHREERDEGAVHRIDVTDEGGGIPAALLPRLFERFVRGRGSAGLGLGLFIAREIVRAHGGELTAENRPAAGARFRITLPTS